MQLTRVVRVVNVVRIKLGKCTWIALPAPKKKKKKIPTTNFLVMLLITQIHEKSETQKSMWLISSSSHENYKFENIICVMWWTVYLWKKCHFEGFLVGLIIMTSTSFKNIFILLYKIIDIKSKIPSLRFTLFDWKFCSYHKFEKVIYTLKTLVVSWKEPLLGIFWWKTKNVCTFTSGTRLYHTWAGPVHSNVREYALSRRRLTFSPLSPHYLRSFLWWV